MGEKKKQRRNKKSVNIAYDGFLLKYNNGQLDLFENMLTKMISSKNAEIYGIV